MSGTAWGWLTRASVKTVMGFLEPPPWAHTSSYPYMLTSPTDAAIPPAATLERVDQEIMSVQTLVGPEAPGSAGDQASPGPKGPLTLQEASPQPPGTEVVEESGEAQWWADHKVPPAPRLPFSLCGPQLWSPCAPIL